MLVTLTYKECVNQWTEYFLKIHYLVDTTKQRLVIIKQKIIKILSGQCRLSGDAD